MVELRVLVGSGIVTAYTWAAAYEFWRGRDEALVSRWPAIFMLFAHGALFLLRTPIGGHGACRAGKQSRDERLARAAQPRGLLFTISIAFILLAMAKERTEYRHRTAARTDPLTGICQPPRLLEQTALSRRSTAGTRPTAVLLFDLDHFKTINDRYGHACRRPRAEDFRRDRQGAYRHGGDGGPMGRR
jgi:predicted signal transduction protein with EAL and GGDEF domain